MSAPPAAAGVRRRSLRSYWLFLLATLLLLGAQMAIDLADARGRIETSAKQRLDNHSRVLYGEMARWLRQVAFTLEHMRQTLPARQAKPGGLDEMSEELRTLNEALDGVRTLAVMDKTGTIIASSRTEVLGRNFAYRPYFQAILQQPLPDRMHVAEPFTTILGVYSLNIVRPMYDAAGNFSGIVSALLDSDSLGAVLESLHAGPTTRLSIVHGGGKLLKMLPSRDEGQPGVDPLEKGSDFLGRHIAGGAPSSLLRGVSAITGTRSFVAVRTLQPAEYHVDTPFYLLAAIDERDVFAEWNALLTERLIFYALICLFAAVGMGLFQRRQRTFERQLQRREEDRQRAYQILQRFIDHLPGTAYVKDAQSRTLMANRGFKTLLGLDPATMIGKTSAELFPAAFAAKIDSDDRAVLNSGQTVTIEERFEGRDFESTKFVIETGGLRQVGGLTFDVTERKRIERQMAEQMTHLRELNAQLETAQNQLLQSEKMASLGQLAAGVAHELNNPIGFVNSNLGTLQGYLDDLFQIADVCETAAREAAHPLDFARIERIKADKDFEFLKSDVYQLVAESLDGLGRVKKIVMDLKNFSRPGEAEWQWADINAGLDSTLNIAWNELKYKCAVVKDYAALPPTYCLISQLNQVFMNLLVNAAQAIEEKGRIEIVTRTEDDGRRVRVEIADSGSGIAPENLSRVFDPFFTTKPIGQGTGLGLSIVWGIVEKHRGHIEAVSAVGHGTRFILTLPVQPPVEAAAVPPAPTFAPVPPPVISEYRP